MSFLLEQHFHLSVLTGFSPPTHERLCCRRRAVCHEQMSRADVHGATLTQIYHLTPICVILRLQQRPLFYIDWCEKQKADAMWIWLANVFPIFGPVLEIMCPLVRSDFSSWLKGLKPCVVC